MATKGKILVLVSSGHGLPLKDGKVYKGAGYYLNELTVPVRALMKEGYEITFANPKGNTPQMDVHSAVPDFFGGDEAKLQDYLKFRDSLTGLKNPTRISDVIASGLDQYDAVFVPGGHGPSIHLLVVATPLRFRGEVLVRIAALWQAVAEETPVENQIDVFRETIDKPIDLGETGATFEDHLIFKVRIGKESLQNPANPKIFLDNDGVHPQITCCFTE